VPLISGLPLGTDPVGRNSKRRGFLAIGLTRVCAPYWFVSHGGKSRARARTLTFASRRTSFRRLHRFKPNLPADELINVTYSRFTLPAGGSAASVSDRSIFITTSHSSSPTFSIIFVHIGSSKIIDLFSRVHRSQAITLQIWQFPHGLTMSTHLHVHNLQSRRRPGRIYYVSPDRTNAETNSTFKALSSFVPATNRGSHALGSANSWGDVCLRSMVVAGHRRLQYSTFITYLVPRT
jgi:hypothetical protein